MKHTNLLLCEPKPLPNIQKLQSKVFKNDTKFYNEKTHKEIKKCYYNLWRDKDDIKSFYTKLRNQIIAEYDKPFKKVVDTKQKFDKYVASHMNPISDIIKTASVIISLTMKSKIKLNTNCILRRVFQ